jgi:hypothetical protein
MIDSREEVKVTLKFKVKVANHTNNPLKDTPISIFAILCIDRTVDFTANLKPYGLGGAATIGKERSRSAIGVSALSEHILGTEFLEFQSRALKLPQDEKLFSKTTWMNLSRLEQCQLALAPAERLRRIVD